jgi:hypothetical protein
VFTPDAVAAALVAAQQPVPLPVQGLALIDTGASLTAVDDNILQNHLKLQPNGNAMISGAHGKKALLTYACKIEFIAMGLVTRHPMVVGVQDLIQQGYIALIGRDFLLGKMLVYNGWSGEYTLSWPLRVPATSPPPVLPPRPPTSPGAAPPPTTTP